MRLIDADALYEKVSDHVTSVSVCATAQQAIGQTEFKSKCLEDIYNALAIDAVPVEWLEAESIANSIIKDIICKWQKEHEEGRRWNIHHQYI